MAVMVVGIGFVALLTAYVADRFIRRELAPVEEDVEDRQLQMLAKLDSISERLERVERQIASRPP